MKKLLLIRHAKATHEPGYDDFERPLKPKGLRDAAMMAGRLLEHKIVPQILISSPALRTLATADVIAEHMSLAKPHEVKKIYDAEQDVLVDVINELDDRFDFIGLVGHNPAIAQVLYYLSGQPADVPPGAVGLLEFDIKSWNEVKENVGKLVFYDSPKDDA
ncbi:histidine phosphatase family protein [Mucilaginibacter sp. dw_454]|uniref:SixA phosphatase family protein n=1 Tax=Mucilaginibacter sp. dw_454 TaxID=2720079 RepID=UPI001BD50C69|nr:histidine phosphatase family protein [Mucilaginibacter sp. dw_454]